MTSLIVIVFGLIVGSFLTVCVYRIPVGRGLIPGDFGDESVEEAKGEGDPVADSDHPKLSIFYPKRSFCPHCDAQLRWYHNIPFLSWLFLRGKCGFCKAPINWRYPAIEVSTAVSAFLSFQLAGLTPTGFVVFALCCALITVSFIDLDYYIIPNEVSLPGTAIGMSLGIINKLSALGGYGELFTSPVTRSVVTSFWGLLVGAGFLFIVSEGYFRIRGKEGLGLGDVKLLALVGATLGPEAAVFTIFLGSLLGSVIGVGLLILGKMRASKPIPFGPYLALGTYIYLFGGTTVLLNAIEGLRGFVAQVF